MHVLPFHDELKTRKTSNAFKGYACSYGIEIIDSKNPSQFNWKLADQVSRGC